MKILVTGSSGFIGKNLITRLTQLENVELFEYDKDKDFSYLKEIIHEIDFIFHLAGINRPKSTDEFYSGNKGFTESLVALLEESNHPVPVLLSSSIQAERDNDYGKSKKEAEDILQEYSKRNNIPVYIYRLPNVFGKWCRPNYNSVVATWCHNVTRDLPIQINDERTMLDLVYIDDVVTEFISKIKRTEGMALDNFLSIPVVHKKTLGEIKNLLFAFKDVRTNLIVPNMNDAFEKALYSTFLSYYPEDSLIYAISDHTDDRGGFYEFVKMFGGGQVSVSTTKPGITRGNHYHHTKVEKFLVIKGEAVIKLRKIDSDHIVEYLVSEKDPKIVDIIPGYTHSITNTGNSDMILLIWANELFDPDSPDTYFLKV